MTIDAIYQGGVFKPLGTVNLPENQQVQLEVRPVSREEALAWIEEARKLREAIRSRCGELPDSTPDISEDRMRDV